MQKKLMILGASIGQLPIIVRAVELGHHVITVDNRESNIGHCYSHQRVNCSTVEREAVLAAARALAVDGIATFASDVATATVGFVAAELGLPGCPTAVAETMSNKAAFRARQHANGQVQAPAYVAGNCWEKMAPRVVALHWPVVFKPVDTSGSRGVSSLDAYDARRGEEAFRFAQHFSRTGWVCAEEFVDGEDVSGDGFLVGSELHAVVTRKYKSGYVPTGHSLPTHLSAADQARVLAEVTANCAAVGYTEGPLDFDVRVAPDRVTVLEMSPRLGGNGIPMLIARSTGVDLVECTIQHALGEAVKLTTPMRVQRGSGSLVFGSGSAGTIAHIADADAVCAQVPEVFSYVTNSQAGNRVEAFTHGGASLGYALFDCPSAAAYSEIVRRVKAAIGLVVNLAWAATAVTAAH